MDELPVLAVHRDEVLRLNRLQHRAELRLVSVAGDVDLVDLRVVDLSAVLVEVVDDLVHEPLVARDGRGRDEHTVALADVDERVALARKPGQG